MAQTDKVVKIYEVKSTGVQEHIDELQQVNQLYIDIKKNKSGLTATKGGLVNSEDAAKLAGVNKQIAELTLKEKQLKNELKEKQILAKEAQLLAAAEKQQKQQAAKDNVALAGSFNDVNKRYKELLAQTKNTTNLLDPVAVENATKDLKELKNQLDNFARGLSKDGTLVGEYTTGILQAFKNSGLTDVIDDQLKKAKQNVTDLDKEFEKLKAELKEIQKTGQGSLQVVEQQLIENRTAAAGFTEQINRVENELRTMNTTGESVVGAMGLQFRNLKRDVAGFILGFVGFQAALTGIQTFTSGAMKEFEDAETGLARFQGRLNNLGRQGEFDGIMSTVDELAGKFKNLDNDDLINVSEKLVTYGKANEKQIKTLLPLIVDFAANARIGLPEASDAIVKALEGNGKALKVYGIDMKDAGNATEAFSLVTEVLGAKVKGSAEIFANTSEGALAKNKQALKDQQEILGEKLVPAYIKFTGILVSVATAILAIPYGAWVTGITAVTTALALYKAEQIRSYIATQLATKEGIIYRTWTITQAIATKTLAAITKVATYEIVLFNGALRVTPLGIFLTLLTLTIGGLKAFASEGNKTVEALDRYKQRLELLNEAQKMAQKSIQDTINKEKIYISMAKDRTLSDSQRQQALDLLIKIGGEHLKGLTLQNLETEKGTKIIEAYNNQLREQALIEAKMSIAKREFEKIKTLQTAKFDLNTQYQEKRQKKEIFYMNELPDDIREIVLGNQNNFLTRNFGEVSRANIEYVNGLMDAAITKQEQRAKDAIQNTGKTLTDIFGDGKPTGGIPNVTLTGGKKDKDPKEVNRIEDLKKAFESEAKLKDTNKKDEASYLEAMLTLIDQYRDKKLKTIKNLTDNEKRSQIDLDNDLLNKKRDILHKQFEAELKMVAERKKLREQEIADMDIDGNTGLTESQKIAQHIKNDNELIAIQIKYNEDVAALETKYSILSQDNAAERNRALLLLQKQLGKDLLAQQMEDYNKLLANESETTAEIKRSITRRAIDILNDKNGGKEKRLNKLEKSGAGELENERLFQIDDELEANEKLLNSKLINQDEYNKRVSELETERLEILKAAGERELEADAQKMKDKEAIYNASLEIASKAIFAELERQRQKIDEDYNNVQKLNQIEKEKRIGQAQSKDEEFAIEEEFQQKQKDAERARNEERKEVAKKQMAVEFALASIRILSGEGTFYEKLAQEAVALAEYLTAVTLVDSQQFYRGGLVLPNGKVTAKQNIPTTPNGDNVLGIVRTGEVILNQQQQAALGGDSTFKAIGVSGFGNATQPPIFRTSSGTNGEVTELKQMVAQLTMAIAAESYKPVLLNPNAVTDSQNKTAKKVDLATI